MGTVSLDLLHMLFWEQTEFLARRKNKIMWGSQDSACKCCLERVWRFNNQPEPILLSLKTFILCVSILSEYMYVCMPGAHRVFFRGRWLFWNSYKLPCEPGSSAGTVSALKPWSTSPASLILKNSLKSFLPFDSAWGLPVCTKHVGCQCSQRDCHWLSSRSQHRVGVVVCGSSLLDVYKENYWKWICLQLPVIFEAHKLLKDRTHMTNGMFRVLDFSFFLSHFILFGLKLLRKLFPGSSIEMLVIVAGRPRARLTVGTMVGTF